jgi:hypothetical protein
MGGGFVMDLLCSTGTKAKINYFTGCGILTTKFDVLEIYTIAEFTLAV